MSTRDRTDFGVLLNVAFHSFKHALDRHLAAAGYDDIGPSFGYVFRLLAEEPRSLSEVARHLQVTLPGALKVVDDMVAKGYVVRSADSGDRRVKRLSLAPRGRAALAQARKFHARCEQSLVARFDARKVAATRSVLEALAEPEDGSPMPGPRPA